MGKETITINISGMTCVNCSNAIEKTTKKMKGVEDAKVNFTTSIGEFIVDTKEVNKEVVIEKIKKLGYKVAENEELLEAQREENFADLKKRFIVGVIFTVILMISHEFFPMNDITRSIMFISSTIVQVYSGFLFYVHAFAALKHKNYDMNVLVALGTTAAYLYSLIAYLFPNFFPADMNYLYFEGSAMIITFILLGKFLEERSRVKATNFLKDLMDLSPQKAIVINKDGEEEEVESRKLNISDIVIVKPGNRISADGVVIEGNAEVDASMLTGESMPVFMQVGDKVAAGTLNQNGFLKIKVEKLATDTILSQIVNLLRDAQSQKMPISRLADRISNIFVPIVIAISLITLCVWLIVGGGFLEGSLAAVSVLIISCPCALGLATPIAIVSALGHGAKNGILIKNPEVVEIIKDIKFAVFDKTGTLTEGKISVKEVKAQDEELLEDIAIIANLSEHPVSKAIKDFAFKNDKYEDDFDISFESIAGKGVRANKNGDIILIGSMAFLEENNVKINLEYIEFLQSSMQDGNGGVLASINDVCVAAFSLEDSIKKDSKETIAKLNKLGITTVMLTGDHEKTANKVGKELGIEKIYAQVLPHEKFNVIKKLQNSGKVLFVGDGINDSPSLKQADIGIALSSGSDIAKEAGDIVLIKNDTMGVVRAINLSKFAMRTVKQNLFWAFFYNIIGIPIAAGVLYPINGMLLTPMYAGMAMSFSSVMVVLNSLRLKLKKI